MNDLTNSMGGTPLTMSSLEIAELTGKQHAHVMRDIRIMFGALKIDPVGQSKFGSTYADAQGKDRECFNIPKRETLLLVSGYNIELRARIIDRLEELESRQSVTVNDLLSNPTQLLALAQGYALQIEDLKRETFAMQKDVETLDRISKAEELYGVREAAQILQIQEKKFTEWLQRNGWCFRHSGSRTLMGYGEKRKAGFLVHKLTTYTKPDGSDGSRETLKFTTKGIVQLAKRFNIFLTEGDLHVKQGEPA